MQLSVNHDLKSAKILNTMWKKQEDQESPGLLTWISRLRVSFLSDMEYEELLCEINWNLDQQFKFKSGLKIFQLLALVAILFIG